MSNCLLVPHYDHIDQFRAFLPGLAALNIPLLVVDDGSPEDVYLALSSLLDEFAPDATLIRLAVNGGKGAAMVAGFKSALQAGFTHAVLIDADGQHALEDIAAVAKTASQYPHELICGYPEFDESIPKLRYYARHISLYLNWLQTLSTEIRDSMCGCRAYPVAESVRLIEEHHMGGRMAFETEFLVKSIWYGLPMRWVPVRVVYPEAGKSHFRYFRDNVGITLMHFKLFFGMLLRAPSLVRRKRRHIEPDISD
jgi:glycosyltransferase involved in cell wall biosynthesis